MLKLTGLSSLASTSRGGRANRLGEGIMGRGDSLFPPSPGDPARGAFDFFLPNERRCRRGLSLSGSNERLKKGNGGGGYHSRQLS